MQSKRILKNTGILTIMFFTPLILISVFASPQIQLNESYKAFWVEEMPSFVNMETGGIIVNNLLVLVIMSLFSIIPFTMYTMKEREGEDYKMVMNVIIFISSVFS